eukprot:TRINITY_DN6108_c0_g5_i2.p1 TRINITY_DN6108_c0_g5~~TRINITY_DN6108_c0_g5_i2.p1  ORF type:complete len:747 (+),score=76.76 TRINITY_DN6108_c0_g5_i2:132-2372(+)
MNCLMEVMTAMRQASITKLFLLGLLLTLLAPTVCNESAADDLLFSEESWESFDTHVNLPTRTPVGPEETGSSPQPIPPSVLDTDTYGDIAAFVPALVSPASVPESPASKTAESTAESTELPPCVVYEDAQFLEAGEHLDTHQIRYGQEVTVHQCFFACAEDLRCQQSMWNNPEPNRQATPKGGNVTQAVSAFGSCFFQTELNKQVAPTPSPGKWWSADCSSAAKKEHKPKHTPVFHPVIGFEMPESVTARQEQRLVDRMGRKMQRKKERALGTMPELKLEILDRATREKRRRKNKKSKAQGVKQGVDFPPPAKKLNPLAAALKEAEDKAKAAPFTVAGVTAHDKSTLNSGPTVAVGEKAEAPNPPAKSISHSAGDDLTVTPADDFASPTQSKSKSGDAPTVNMNLPAGETAIVKPAEETMPGVVDGDGVTSTVSAAIPAGPEITITPVEKPTPDLTPVTGFGEFRRFSSGRRRRRRRRSIDPCSPGFAGATYQKSGHQTVQNQGEQCQTGVPGAVLQFLFKDGCGCTSDKYEIGIEQTSFSIGGAQASCMPRPDALYVRRRRRAGGPVFFPDEASAVSTCSGTVAGTECVWSVTLPATTPTLGAPTQEVAPSNPNGNYISEYLASCTDQQACTSWSLTSTSTNYGVGYRVCVKLDFNNQHCRKNHCSPISHTCQKQETCPPLPSLAPTGVPTHLTKSPTRSPTKAPSKAPTTAHQVQPGAALQEGRRMDWPRKEGARQQLLRGRGG